MAIGALIAGLALVACSGGSNGGDAAAEDASADGLPPYAPTDLCDDLAENTWRWTRRPGDGGVPTASAMHVLQGSDTQLQYEVDPELGPVLSVVSMPIGEAMWGFHIWKTIPT